MIIELPTRVYAAHYDIDVANRTLRKHLETSFGKGKIDKIIGTVDTAQDHEGKTVYRVIAEKVKLK